MAFLVTFAAIGKSDPPEAKKRKKKRKIEIPLPLSRSLVTFFRQGKKVTRRRQKRKPSPKAKKGEKGNQAPPYHTLV